MFLYSSQKGDIWKGWSNKRIQFKGQTAWKENAREEDQELDV